jgi:hypothetical protein
MASDASYNNVKNRHRHAGRSKPSLLHSVLLMQCCATKTWEVSKWQKKGGQKKGQGRKIDNLGKDGQGRNLDNLGKEQSDEQA